MGIRQVLPHRFTRRGEDVSRDLRVLSPGFGRESILHIGHTIRFYQMHTPGAPIRGIEMGQNILNLLRQEHAKMLMQLGELQQREIRDRAELFKEMKNTLLPHMAGEERVFYPRLEEQGLHDLVTGSREEHKIIQALIDRLNNISTADEEDWVDVMSQLQEAVRGHVDREEKTVFPEARQKIDDALLLRIGNRFEEAKGKAHLQPLR
ncbi:MAG: Hemerythrin HHE cation binding domain-containing protein [Methanoculleus marisnigri]|uniref:Hemerythrin HHE cation binding domain-containing protein n=1 Tax=Methanoculleus marisnigri TaxID=2198 RepID=A0A101GN89_9EURY|nr:MAG: Hemerythrin HHE cation binding domain-containing protein [Methanoculleus marisnigri]